MFDTYVKPKQNFHVPHIKNPNWIGMRKRILLYIMLILVTVSQVLAQTGKKITGTISSPGKTGLAGVSVRIKGTTTGVSTDEKGQFTLTVPNGAVLVISTIGFQSKEVTVGSLSDINVSLAESADGLNEVLVVGYGTQRRAEVSGAISSVKGSSISNLPTQSLDKAIQGKAAGVQVNSSNGLPGGMAEVRIRGVGSVNAGNQPLYIIDGVQINSTSRSSNLASSNPLSSINADDIESVEILKDAAAASIYGAQAGNGVILITTKSGKNGKAQINFNAYGGFTDMVKRPSLLNGSEWTILNREATANTGNLTGPYLADVANGAAKDAKTYDWMDAVTRKGKVQNYELSVSGGNDKTRYFIGSSFNDQVYHFIGYDFSRGTFRANLDSKISDKFSIETKMNISSVKQHSSDIPSFQLYNIFITGLSMTPIDPIYNPDGSYNTSLHGWDNPLQDVEQNRNIGVTNQAIGNFALNYDILPGLRFKSSYSLEYTAVNEELFYDPRNNAGVAVNGLVRFNNSKVVNWQTDQTLNYTKKIGSLHNISGLLGFNYRNETFTTLLTQGNGVAIPSLGQTLTGTAPAAVASTFNQFITAGIFGRVGYNYDNKYIAQFTLRRDGSSRFGSNNKFGYFPAVSAAWRLVDEKFMSRAAFLSELKIRASYGETGNSEIAYYPALSLFTSNATAAYNNTAGITFSQLGNSNLGWERNVTQNFGIDYGFFNNRISGSVDYFIRTTKDLLLNRPLPNTSGFTSIAENVGSLENRGFEFGLNTVNVTGDFKWTTDFNFSLIKNKVLSLINAGQDLPANNLWVGHPLGEQFLVKWAGVNPANGRPMWYDRTGNITYLPVAADRTFGIGSALIPDYYGGLTNTFSYKGFELSGFLQFQVGTVQQDQPTAWLLSDFRYNYNQLTDALNRWTTPGQITSVPRLYPGAVQPGTSSSIFGGSGASSDKFYSDASYLRLKTLTVSYTVPVKFLSGIKARTARIYAQGYNLWTATNYSGLDPEFTAGGYNMGLAPQGKSYTFGVSLGL